DNRLHEVMDRVSEQIALRLRRIASSFPDDHRDVALLQPRQDGIVECRGTVVGSELRPSTIPPPAKHERVAGTGLHTGLLFPRLEVFWKDAIARRQIRHPLQ